ncbi:hypothetical protein [Caminicella sporogenes]|uniref:hypothetical protein n=1 Tax=Caminicella sporogenes TaxID=166485 RepID=UPI00254099F4|nr:hypothetical protein [Caminicella sporogenes]WIF95822.1 hypothetical protein QNI18_04185 [Caminicella sporogenes]
MIKKIVTGTLVLVILSASSTIIYANTDENKEVKLEDNKEVVQLKEEIINLISPKISPLDEVIQEKDDLLISVQILTDSTVTISVYRQLEDDEELIFEEEDIKKEDLLFDTYNKELKDIEPGDYKIEFRKDDEEEPFKTIEFKIKKELPDLSDKSITDLLLGK